MRIGAFTIDGPLPELHQPHAIAMVGPWTDAGRVATLALEDIERQFGAQEFARIANPGSFYDFTRYRPIARLTDGTRELSVPNTVVSFARRTDDVDLVIVKMLEPHICGEAYVEDVISLLEALGVRRYVWIGSMYDMVPHTRRLLVSGSAIGSAAQRDVLRLKILPSDYEGPSSITFQIVQKAPERTMEVLWCIVHLPQYVQVDEDYVGKVRLMELLQGLYGFSVEDADRERARDQIETIDEAMHGSVELVSVVSQFERHYQSRLNKRRQGFTALPREVEDFLSELGGDEEQG
ncbi:MAG: PAC2 family protein [Dehalococcoidia bacterium]|nr:MAG: PAC2 family protein [Dehalococcoidia bacterium]